MEWLYYNTGIMAVAISCKALAKAPSENIRCAGLWSRMKFGEMYPLQYPPALAFSSKRFSLLLPHIQSVTMQLNSAFTGGVVNSLHASLYNLENVKKLKSFKIKFYDCIHWESNRIHVLLGTYLNKLTHEQVQQLNLTLHIQRGVYHNEHFQETRCMFFRVYSDVFSDVYTSGILECMQKMKSLQPTEFHLHTQR